MTIKIKNEQNNIVNNEIENEISNTTLVMAWFGALVQNSGILLLVLVSWHHPLRMQTSVCTAAKHQRGQSEPSDGFSWPAQADFFQSLKLKCTAVH